MSESFDSQTDCSFTFDTSLSAEFDLTIYAGIIYELAVLPSKQKKIYNEELFPDLNIVSKDNDSAEHEDVDMNQTHLTDEFNQIFSYFDQDVEELTDNSDDELNKIVSDFDEFSDEEIGVVSDDEFDGHEIIENISDHFRFENNEENETDSIDSVVALQEDFLTKFEEKSNKDRMFDDLSREIGVGNVREKVLRYNKMLAKINEDLESEKRFFRKKLEENVSKDNNSIERYTEHANDDLIETISDFELLSKYVKKLSSIESYAQILSRLNRLVNAISQLDKDRLNGMNLKSLKNFMYFIKIYSVECVNMSTAIRKDIAVDLEKNLLTHEDLLYCLDVVANEVNPFCPVNTKPLLTNNECNPIFSVFKFFPFLRISASRE